MTQSNDGLFRKVDAALVRADAEQIQDVLDFIASQCRERIAPVAADEKVTDFQEVLAQNNEMAARAQAAALEASQRSERDMGTGRAASNLRQVS